MTNKSPNSSEALQKTEIELPPSSSLVTLREAPSLSPEIKSLFEGIGKGEYMMNFFEK